MPIIKVKAIHFEPVRLLNYITNAEKTEEMKLVTGINCHEDPDIAYDDFRDVYERYAHEPFNKKPPHEQEKAEKGKDHEPVLIFHYIQSFVPGEVTPELAHKIGIEWARRVFGDDRAVLVSTHDDKEHTHNHFAVSIFDSRGKRWYGNKKTLKKARDISDKLAKEYGLSVLTEGKEKKNYNYAEWIARKSGTSWKVKIAEELDRIVCAENVNSISDLMRELSHKGYSVSYGKYLSIRPKGMKRGVRSYRLGDGYSVDVLLYRIEHKDREISAAEVESYTGLQRDYAMCMREMQIAFYRHTEERYGYKKATYADLLRTSQLLCYISEQKITSEDMFKEVVNNADEKYRQTEQKKKELEEKIRFERSMIKQYPAFMYLWNKKDDRTPEETEELEKYRVLMDYGMFKEGKLQEHRLKVKKLEKDLSVIEKELPALKGERATVADNYKQYLSITENSFSKILERKRQEQEALEREEQRRLEEKLRMEEYQREQYCRAQQSQRRDTWSLGGR